MKNDILPDINDTTLFKWLILLSSTFTVFAFWGWISYTLVEYAKKKEISASMVYFVIMIVSVGILVGIYALYYLLIKSQSEAIPGEKEPRIKLRNVD